MKAALKIILDTLESIEKKTGCEHLPEGMSVLGYAIAKKELLELLDQEETTVFSCKHGFVMATQGNPHCTTCHADMTPQVKGFLISSLCNTSS